MKTNSPCKDCAERCVGCEEQKEGVLKMTNEQIIKALCKHIDNKANCTDCSYFGKRTETGSCLVSLFSDVYNLINRQKAEIERLQKYYDKMEGEIYSLREDQAEVKFFRQEIEAETIKKFVERLKNNSYPFPCAIGVEHAVTIRAINDLVKEMVGDN